MGKALMQPVYEDIVNIQAGSASDGTNSYYVDVKDFNKGNLQVNWTSGDSGTIGITTYGTMIPFKDKQTAKDSDSGDIFQSISSLYQGTDSISGDYRIQDTNNIMASYSFAKITVAITSSDSTTSYRIGMFKTE